MLKELRSRLELARLSAAHRDGINEPVLEDPLWAIENRSRAYLRVQVAEQEPGVPLYLFVKPGERLPIGSWNLESGSAAIAGSTTFLVSGRHSSTFSASELEMDRLPPPNTTNTIVSDESLMRRAGCTEGFGPSVSIDISIRGEQSPTVVGIHARDKVVLEGRDGRSLVPMPLLCRFAVRHEGNRRAIVVVDASKTANLSAAEHVYSVDRLLPAHVRAGVAASGRDTLSRALQVYEADLARCQLVGAGPGETWEVFA